MTPWMIFAITGVGVYAIRLTGVLALAGDRPMPPIASRALRLVAPAAVTAVVASAVLLDHGQVRPWSAWHVAAVVAIAVTWWRRSMALTIVVGMATFGVARVLGL